MDELDQVIRRELFAALRGLAGFCGAFSLLDRATGRALVVILWETDEEAARPLVRCGAPLLEALAAVAELSGGDPCAHTVWEVSARG